MTVCAAMAETGDGSGSSVLSIEETDKLLERLNLRDEEMEEIDVEEIKKKWLSLVRLLTTKRFSQIALIADMKVAWNPT